MAKKPFSKFVGPDGDARAAEAAKTSRLRALRLAKEAEDAAEAARLDAAAKLAKPRVRRRTVAADPTAPQAAELG